MGDSTPTVHKIVKKNGLEPYKLFDRDFGLRIEFAMRILLKIGDDAQFVRNLLITDECTYILYEGHDMLSK